MLVPTASDVKASSCDGVDASTLDEIGIGSKFIDGKGLVRNVVAQVETIGLTSDFVSSCEVC